jgi:molybdopterin-biosynthesis enzyme MoeA-like protein
VNAPRAAILSVGDELVLGTTLDTNSRTLSSALREAGLDVVEHRTVARPQCNLATLW